MILKVIIKLIKLYKNYLSNYFRSAFAGGCRYLPTCSDYAIAALEKYGIFKGGLLSLIRLFHCNPFSKKDIYDII